MITYCKCFYQKRVPGQRIEPRVAALQLKQPRAVAVGALGAVGTRGAPSVERDADPNLPSDPGGH